MQMLIRLVIEIVVYLLKELRINQLLISLYLLVMCLGEMATENDENRVRSLFSAIGKVWTAEEKYFDAVTGLRYVTNFTDLFLKSFTGNNML